MALSKWISSGVIALVGLSASAPAHALSCDEILNMVRVNVPASIVVQTMENSGSRFTSDDVRCLVNGGAPDEVIEVARNLAGGSSAPAPAAPSPSAPADDDEPAGFDRESMLAGDINEIGEDESSDSPAKLDAIIDAYKAKSTSRRRKV